MKHGKLRTSVELNSQPRGIGAMLQPIELRSHSFYGQVNCWFKSSRQRDDEMNILLKGITSAVARGGAGGARAPPVFLLKSKN